MIFITVGGLSIDFPTGEGESGISYFVATEDALVHKCQTSNPDLYMYSYYGHTGPIYRIRCNPFWHVQECPIFLTCSYDWTIKIWNAEETTPKLNCCQMSGEILRDQVNDVQWSPNTSSCFASVAKDGRIEVWDLALNELNPVITHFDKIPGTAGTDDEKRDDTEKTIVRFSAKSPVLLTGNVKGQVDVYRTKGLEHV